MPPSCSTPQGFPVWVVNQNYNIIIVMSRIAMYKVLVEIGEWVYFIKSLKCVKHWALRWVLDL